MDEPMAGTTLSGDEWEQAQYLPGASVATAPFGPDDPKKKKPAVPNTTNLGRVLTGDEWEQAQTQSGPQVKALQIPRLPTLAKAPTDLTGTQGRVGGGSKGTPLAPFNLADPTTYANPVLRQIVNPALDNPIQTAVTGMALATPGVGQIVGGVMAGSMALDIARYGYQKHVEQNLSPEARAEVERDPQRVTGEAAAVQAAMLGLAPLIHVGVKAMQGPSYGAGMLEAGASGVHETMADPAVAAERTAPFQGELNAAHAAYLEEGSATTRIPADVPKPAGFTATAGGATLKTTPRAVAGLIAPESATPGKVKPLATVPVGEFQDATKIVNESGANALSGIDMSAVRSNAAIRRRNGGELTLSESRSEAADAIAKADRFRPRSGPANLFETEQGAQILGAAAARHAMPETANPYHPDSPLATEWDQGHAAGLAASKNMAETGFASIPSDDPSTVQLPQDGAGRSGSTVDAVATAKRIVGPDKLRQLADAELARRGDPDVPEARMAAMEQVAREIASRQPTPEYPDGFSMGGALTDNRIPGAVELPKRARGIDAPPATENEALAAALKPPPIPDEPARGLASVEGTGETKTRGLSAGVQEKAVANTLTNTLGDLPEYRTVNMADQATRASDLLSSDYALARRVALGEVNAPAGLLPEAVFTAVENRAIAEGDVATIRDLATGGLTTEATTMGQRIRALAERDPDSPVSAISRVVDARSGGVENVDAQTAKLAAQIKKHLDTIKLPEDALAKLLDSLRC